MHDLYHYYNPDDYHSLICGLNLPQLLIPSDPVRRRSRFLWTINGPVIRTRSKQWGFPH